MFGRIGPDLSISVPSPGRTSSSTGQAGKPTRTGNRLDRAGLPWLRRAVISIRATRSADHVVIQQIERAAGELFRAVGMADIADHPDPALEALAGFQRAGRSWVAVDGADRPVAFVLVLLVDEHAHV